MSFKSKKKAKKTNSDLQAGQQDNSGIQSCPHKKHWFGVVVKDEDGNAVTDVQVHIALNDGSTLDPTLSDTGGFRTERVMDKTDDCKVSFPNLVDCEWWPEGGSAPKGKGTTALTANDGDCVSSMTPANGYRNYHTIWDVPENKDLKKNRPNPNCLMPNDSVKAPGEKTKVVSKPVDADAAFVVRNLSTAKARIVVVDKELKAMSGQAWDISSGSSTKQATTGGDGLVEVPEIDLTATSGTLKVSIQRPPGAGPTPEAAGPADPKAYPIVIRRADFIDKNADKPDGQDQMEWTLKVGSLPPFKEKTGVLARLHNFGFGCDVDSDDDGLKTAVTAFQRVFLKDDKPSGAYADIQQDLEDRHSNP